jgi:hypothetical protein
MAYMHGRTVHSPAAPGTVAAYRRRSSMERAIGEFGVLEQAGPNVAVSKGEFGRALRGLGIPNAVVKLLKLSPTFRKMIATLDKRYVYIWNPAETQHRRLLPQTSADGLVTSGTFKGRRIINVQESQTGSTFEPYTSPDNPGYYDLISIKKPAASETGEWLEVIAHETAHAFHAVNPPAPSSAKGAADRIRAAVAEEIATRRIEAAVLSEILKTASGRRTLAGFAPSTGSSIRRVVERDFFPSPLRRTYLEHFVLIELLRQAIERENLTDHELEAKNKEISRIPIRGWRTRKFPSDYSKIRFWMRVIDFRWRRAMQLHRPGTVEFARLKEQILQEHANAFFSKLIGYTR